MTQAQGRFSGALLLTMLIAIGCSGTPETVTRIVAGRPEEGRFVSPNAYAWYARGAYLEALGELEPARAAFSRALSYDPESVEIWTRMASLECRIPGFGDALGFAQAAEIDPDYEPLWYERARCQFAKHDVDGSLKSALVAIGLDPNRPETSLLIAEIREARGEAAEAERWRRGYRVRWPELSAAEPGRSQRAGERAARESALVDALARSDLDEARRLAVLLRMPKGTLAVRAAALGALDSARRQATHVLGADPEDADALVALLAAAQDDRMLSDGLRRLTSNPKLRPGSLSPLATLVMARVLKLRVGEMASDAWLRASGPLPAPQDALEGRLLEGLLARRAAASP